MNRIWIKVVAAALVIAAIVAAVAIIIANRPLARAPQGTAPLDNRVDTAAVAHLVVDESGVLSEEAEQVFSIYNANWTSMEDRVMAVVVVDRTADTEAAAWQWAQKLSLGENDALLLIESETKKCAVVSRGTFEEDIATLSSTYLGGLTYMALRAGAFDGAVLAVFEEFHRFCEYTPEQHRQTMVKEGLTTSAIIFALILPGLIHMIAEKVDNRRFRRWYEYYGASDPARVPWKTAFFWHRAGSKWYEVRVSGEWIDYRAALRTNRHERRAKVASGRYR